MWKKCVEFCRYYFILFSVTLTKQFWMNTKNILQNSLQPPKSIESYPVNNASTRGAYSRLQCLLFLKMCTLWLGIWSQNEENQPVVRSVKIDTLSFRKRWEAVEMLFTLKLYSLDLKVNLSLCCLLPLLTFFCCFVSVFICYLCN